MGWDQMSKVLAVYALALVAVGVCAGVLLRGCFG
jgi:hypothetical protein